MDSDKKKISCRRCQLRKLKCTRLCPCDNCVTSGNECSFRDDDFRRRPVSRAYVAALEERLASYEATIRSMKQSLINPSSLLSSTSLTQTSMTAPELECVGPDLIFDYSGSSRVSTLILQPSPQGHRSFYGPTSIYQKGCVTGYANSGHQWRRSSTFNQYQQDIHLSGIFKVDDIILKESLSMFFRHLNAECPFIDEPTLVGDFTQNKYEGKFWSYPLLYAICCLGARISKDKQVSTTVEALGSYVNKLLSIKSLQSLHITTVQAFLCLSLFEFGAGNNTKGWILSGMAFRMVQDMGLHQDPKFLVKDDNTINLSQDSRMRRKVYWGCYVIDKVISLYFGRPIYLREDDASVDPLDLQNDQINAKETLETPGANPALSSLLTDIIPSSLILIQLAHLGKIIELMMTEVFSTRLIKLPRKDLVTHRVAKLEELNLRLFQWHTALPEFLAWSQWTPTTQNLPPQLAILHALYHSCIISLNRHFIKPTPGFARKSQSQEICISSADSIMAITRQYRAQHSLTTAPLILVYSLTMAVTAVTFALDNSTTSPQGNQASELGQHMNFLLKTLKECSKTYDVALDISEKLEKGMFSRKKRSQAEVNDSSSEDEDNSRDAAQSSTKPIILQETMQAGIGSWVPPWWNDDVVGFAEPSDAEGELGMMPFPEDQEGDMVSNFDWSNILL